MFSFSEIDGYPLITESIEKQLSNLTVFHRGAMSRFTLSMGLGVALATLVLLGLASGQVTSPQLVVSASAAVSSSIEVGADESVDETSIGLDPASLLADLPSLPNAKATLVGGTIARLDRVHDQLTVQVFGGGEMKIAFDTRTHISRDGADDAAASSLRRGDRVSADTILDGSTVFARNIRLRSSVPAGESQGVVVSYRADKGELVVRDVIFPRPLTLHLTSDTQFVEGNNTAASTSELVPGTLISAKFEIRDGYNTVRELSVRAVPGSSIAFAGRITAVDLRLGLLVLVSAIDGMTYEISFDPSAIGLDDRLSRSADVSILTRFDGGRYVARSVTVTSQHP
jgi:hypothetical protein